MDNVSHTLTGLVLARAGLNRLSPHATAILLLSANIPDIDIVALTGGPLRYLEVHRGYSHCLLCLPLLALLSVLLTAALFRRRLPWLRAILIACIGVASHLLLDWTNSYGIRLFLPFSSQWFHLDLNSLYDGFFLLVLGAAAVWPLLANLVSGEIGDRANNGRGVAVTALLAIGLFECGRAVLHARSVGRLQSRVYEDSVALQVAALPDPFNPFRWTGVVETESAYRSIPILMSGELDIHNEANYYKPPVSRALQILKADENFRYFQYFARFPVWTIQNGPPGLRSDLTDLRFGTPGAGAFHCIALQNASGSVLRTWFTYGSGEELGQ